MAGPLLPIYLAGKAVLATTAGVAARYGAKKLAKKLLKRTAKKLKVKKGHFVSKQSELTRKGKKIDRKERDQFSKDYGEGHDFPEGNFQEYLKKTPGLLKKKPKITHTKKYLNRMKNTFPMD